MITTIHSYLHLAATYVSNSRKCFQDSHPYQPLAWIHPLRDPHEASYCWYQSINVICDEVAQWEKLPDLKEPIMVAMVNDLCQQQNPLMLFSATTVIYDWTGISMYTCHHLSE